MTFSVSGKAKSGISIFGGYLTIFLLGGSAMVLYTILSGEFSILMIIMGLFMVGFSVAIFFPLKASMKTKTLIIEDGLVSLFVEDELKKSTHLEDVTSVETISLSGKTPRGGFMLKNGKRVVFECNWRDHMEREKLIKAFREILKYRGQYGFEVNDRLRWA
jgi:hypothetical protein